MMIKIFFSIYLLFLIAPYSLRSMHTKPLTPLDEKILYREISRSGLSAVERDNNQGSLHIHDIFFPEEPDSVNIFNAIATIELTGGYHPEPVQHDEHYVTRETNYLGNYTQYYWQNWKKDGAFVTTTSKITNKDAVTHIITQEKKRINQAMLNKK